MHFPLVVMRHLLSDEVLAGMILDLGLLPSSLCTPSLLSAINEELSSSFVSGAMDASALSEAREFACFFAHRNHRDRFYREYCELSAPSSSSVLDLNFE